MHARLTQLFKKSWENPDEDDEADIYLCMYADVLTLWGFELLTLGLTFQHANQKTTMSFRHFVISSWIYKRSYLPQERLPVHRSSPEHDTWPIHSEACTAYHWRRQACRERLFLLQEIKSTPFPVCSQVYAIV